MLLLPFSKSNKPLMTWHYRDFTMINGVSFIFKNHSQMYAANQFIVLFVTFLLLKYVHVYVCMSASALLCVCFLCCISIHPLPAQSRQSFLCYYSSQTTCTCLPERNFSFLLLATLFKRIYKRICLTSLVPEMHLLVEILESPTTTMLSLLEMMTETCTCN